MPRTCSRNAKIMISRYSHSSFIPILPPYPPLVQILISLIDSRPVFHIGAGERLSEILQCLQACVVAVQAADDLPVQAKVGETAGEVGYGVQDQDICCRDDKVVAGQPGEEVEEAFEDRHHARGRAIREVAVDVDGGDTRLGGGLEAGGGLEGISAAVVQEAEALVGPARRLPTESDFAAIAGRKRRRNPPGLAVVK